MNSEEDKKRDWINVNKYQCRYSSIQKEKIYKEIKAKLIKGKKPVQNPEVIFVSGLPGSGKTTYTHNIIKENQNYIILDVDYIFYNLPQVLELMKKNILPIHGINTNCIKLAKQILDKLILDLSKINYNIIIDHPFISGSNILLFKDNDYNIKIVLIHNDKHEAFREKRFQITGQSKLIKKQYANLVKDRILLFWPLADKIEFIINTENINMDTLINLDFDKKKKHKNLVGFFKSLKNF